VTRSHSKAGAATVSGTVDHEAPAPEAVTRYEARGGWTRTLFFFSFFFIAAAAAELLWTAYLKAVDE
jgi:hypothetical protein